MNLIKILPLLCFLLVAQMCYAQNQSRSHLQLENKSYYEKIYAHVDRDLYSPQDTMWYKIYLVDGITHVPVKGLRNFYSQLLSSDGKIVKEQSLLINRGLGCTYMNIPKDIKEGYYTLRLYTAYQQNFSESDFFHKKIWVSRPKNSTELKNTQDNLTNKISFDLMPEGGNLLYEVNNIVAFKAINQNGLGLSVSGSIVDSQDNEVVRFKTMYQGMGKMVFKPKKGEQYYVKINEFPAYKKQIEKINEYGLSLSFRFVGGRALVMMHANLDKDVSRNYSLVALSRGKVMYSEEFLMDSDTKNLFLDKNYFPSGISKIVILNTDNVPVSERLMFNNVIERRDIEVYASKREYASREEVTLRMKPEVCENDTSLSFVSVAVVHQDYLHKRKVSQTILSYLLLDAELRNKIENPSDFFVDDSTFVSIQKLDLLMMTHGWRTYSYLWDELPEIIESKSKRLGDAGIKISGSMKKYISGRPVKGGNLQMLLTKGKLYMQDVKTKDDGTFEFTNVFLTDSTKIAFKCESDKGKRTVAVDFNPVFRFTNDVSHDYIKDAILPPHPSVKFYEGIFTRSNALTQFELKKGMIMLDEVNVVKNKVTKKPEDQIYGEADETYEITDNDLIYLDLLSYLLSTKPELTTEGGELVMNRSGSFVEGGNDVLITLDGVPLSDGMGYLTGLSMVEIERVDILTSPTNLALYGVDGANGVVAIYTRRGDGSKQNLKSLPGELALIIKGYEQYKEFYMPRYNIRNNPLIPDFRPTMFWKPFVNIKSNEEQVLKFYSSDELGDYKIITEGITSDGRVCIGEADIRVK